MNLNKPQKILVSVSTIILLMFMILILVSYFKYNDSDMALFTSGFTIVFLIMTILDMKKFK
jgi:hypothetical protein